VQSKGLLEYVSGILETGPYCLFTLEFLFRGEEERKVVERRGVGVTQFPALAVSFWTFAGFGRWYGFAKSFFGEGRALSGKS
jgi:hypothetical protein